MYNPPKGKAQSNLQRDGLKFDIGIIGGGVLGVSIAFWISELYDCSIGLFETESKVGQHTSSRNTGVVHRPFYLNPETKKVFARTSEKSYSMWKKLALAYSLPWKDTGTIEVALQDQDIDTLEKYRKWSLTNGMREEETEILDASGVSSLEPEVKCMGAIYSKNDASVNYGESTDKIGALASTNGVKFLLGCEIKDLNETESGVEIRSDAKKFSCDFLINVAGGNSLDLAQRIGLVKEYADLHFRGEYWRVDESFASKVRRNVYSVAKYKEFPFLDPHFIVRANGTREIGPNAVLVPGPNTYEGLGGVGILRKIFERPLGPKFRLFTNRKFLSLAWGEWRSSLSKNAMCDRVKEFIPSLESSMLKSRGVAGVRSSLIDKNGFVPEALEVYGKRSLHVLNYNSPGASGAPSFSAFLVSNLESKGFLNGLRKKSQKHEDMWNYEVARDLTLMLTE